MISEYVSDLHTRVYAWIRITGTYEDGGWATCYASHRLVGFLDILNIEYTIQKSKVHFTFLDHNNDTISFWNVLGEPFYEEFFFIKNFAKVPMKLHIEDSEEIAFTIMLESINVVYEGTEGRVRALKRG